MSDKGMTFGEFKEKELNKKLVAIWNFFPEESLPKEDKPILIFRPNHTPEVIGAFYEGDIEHGEFHNGGDDVHRIVYSGVKAWTDVLSAPILKETEEPANLEPITIMNEQAASSAVETIVMQSVKYRDGIDHSNENPNITNKDLHGHDVSECVNCGEKENVTITENADICHECGYVYE